ncbi:MAG TPA: hypothetical protein VKX39_12515 [Bryobacteraceae bacterium]|jgi:photosystem II stability/assembly factor-like uncharacterized protein|nr:hypothetical protein [Bryobacteraceae bacterium]
MAESGPRITGPYKDIRWREIGPFRGGRVLAVAGVDSQPQVFYFGATGGGVFKTTDGGASWVPVSDGQFTNGDVGAIAVAPSDPNVVYVGMGEACIRGNTSPGNGVYKSTDAGKTWKHVGLDDTQQIGKVVIDPRDANVVYVAALGHAWGPNEMRGVYKTTDGGATWKQVLTRGPKAGAVDLSIDPSNPNTIYAAFWEVYRNAYDLESGGPGSGLWKSTDGGATWKDLTRNPGMPKGVIGRVGVSVSPANPQRVYALVEAEEGGAFRSDNGGDTWIRVNSSNEIRQRAWYYTHVLADPKNADEVYFLNVNFFRSTDGGRSLQPIRPPHGDNHGLWIASNDPNRMIESNDGGATITFNGGRSWSTEDNQPTAQFYRVALDNDFPYHAYGAQQDNSTVRIATRGGRGGITERDWYDVGGGESGWIAPDPRDTAIVYAGSYGNLITRFDAHTGLQRNINPWPDNPMGHPASDLKYRFQWSFPIIISPHDPTVIYAGANVLFKSTDEGQSWTPISGDLTRNDKSKQGSSGGPITKDNTSIEYYDTIFTINESPITKGLIWVGSDDGLIHLTRDGGKTWINVTPSKDILPEWAQINAIDPSPYDPGTAYVAATKYKFDDYHPYLYKTTDYGKTWTKMTNGIPEDHFTRVVREDPNHKGMLFAGTEFGIYVSYDSGDHWQSIQLNLPVVPITDLAFQKRDNELVVATQGRAFWVMDDLDLLYQIRGETPTEDVKLFKPRVTLRAEGGRGFGGGGAVGQNPPSGAVIEYYFKEKPQGDVTIEFLDASGKSVNKYTSHAPEQNSEDRARAEAEAEFNPFANRGPARVPANEGMNRFIWDLHYPDATTFPHMILWAGSTRGPVAIPGTYTVKLTANGKTETQTFALVKDPRLKTTPEQYQRQLALALQIRDKLSQTNQAVIDIREAKKQLGEYVSLWHDNPNAKKVVDMAQDLSKKLSAVEEELYQVKNQAAEDPLNYPIKLNNRIASLLGVVEQNDAGPTRQSEEVNEELTTQVNAQLRAAQRLLTDEIASFNKLVKEANIPAVTIKPKFGVE